MRLMPVSFLALFSLPAVPGLAAKPPAAPAPPAQVEFLRDVAPILDRSGCSSAACHGKFGGRGGFQVSLLTLSPEDDFEPLVYGGRGRRINFAQPEKSLLLMKATMEVPHVGGSRFAVGSPQYNTLIRWIKAGAPFDSKDPRLVSLAVKPDKLILEKVGDSRALKVMATYTDGSVRDVTRQTAFQSTNSAVLNVTQDGVVSGQRWGGGAVLGRYLGTIAASFITLPQARKGKYPTITSDNAVDKYVFDNLKRLNVLPSALSTDTEFLRRITLDTIGRVPTPAEIQTFVDDKGADKRSRVIASLLNKPEYADYRTLRLADLLRVKQSRLGGGVEGERAATLFNEWIWNNVSQNVPWDQFVRELITARGSTFQVGPANFYRIERDANARMETVGQAFLGVRMSCARCHKHPFDRWTTDDYWNFSAFLCKAGVQGGKLYDENVVVYDGSAQIRNESVNGKNRGKIAPATYLGEKDPAKPTPDMIASLANWMTSPNNPFFAKATVNRLWSFYFGRGVVHPVDDMRATTPESVPGLLDALAKVLVDNKYDTRALTSVILNSRTYQLSSIPNSSNEKDDRFFSHSFPRPMPSEPLLDIVNQATGAKEQFGSFPERARAVQSALPPGNYFLSSFGQSHREFLADIDPKLEPNLVQTLLMINSPYIEEKIKNGGMVDAIVKSASTDADVVKGLYLRTFCRPPSTSETTRATTLMKTAKDRREGAQDLLWALLTAREFYFNH